GQNMRPLFFSGHFVPCFHVIVSLRRQYKTGKAVCQEGLKNILISLDNGRECHYRMSERRNRMNINRPRIYIAGPLNPHNGGGAKKFRPLMGRVGQDR
ncbi:MAG: hypothetical protein PHC52_14995, partial [Syntrophales bacterium]|nr:hypothetical protein [Syntrophales bacterium]